MLDPYREELLPLSILAREVPSRTGRRGVDVATVWRWCRSGSRGVRLESVIVGGIRMSSREAIARFVAATTAAADGTPSPAPRTSAARERAIAAAERELAESGI